MRYLVKGEVDWRPGEMQGLHKGGTSLSTMDTQYRKIQIHTANQLQLQTPHQQQNKSRKHYIKIKEHVSFLTSKTVHNDIRNFGGATSAKYLTKPKSRKTT